MTPLTLTCMTNFPFSRTYSVMFAGAGMTPARLAAPSSRPNRARVAEVQSFNLVVLSHLDLMDNHFDATVGSLEVLVKRLEGLPLYIGLGKLGTPAGEEAGTFQSDCRRGAGEGYDFAFELSSGYCELITCTSYPRVQTRFFAFGPRVTL